MQPRVLSVHPGRPRIDVQHHRQSVILSRATVAVFCVLYSVLVLVLCARGMFLVLRYPSGLVLLAVLVHKCDNSTTESLALSVGLCYFSFAVNCLGLAICTINYFLIYLASRAHPSGNKMLCPALYAFNLEQISIPYNWKPTTQKTTKSHLKMHLKL